ncbi:Flp pilus assembly protein CpaB [Poriferisphaera sp. WC338]|uniref:Flp pilus assembly protein CpaB n=1 Tax=Poriferisphaera sp. WC338 TaxID=3425129 RepID=UPI003D8158FB
MNTNSPTNTSSAQQQGSTKLVIVAVVLALVVTLLNFLYIQAERKKVSEQTVTVYRFKRPMKAGDTVSPDDLRASPLPKSYQSSFSEAYVDETGKDDVLMTADGRRLVRPVRENEVLSSSVFTDQAYDRIDQKIAVGKRLIALPVNHKTLPAVLRPGMYVDIEAPFARRNRGVSVLPVMEYVRVLAVGKKSILDEKAETSGKLSRLGSYSTISIEVTPEQATQFSRIQRIATGAFELHLRPPSDRERPKIVDGGINPNVIELLSQATPTTASR